MHLLSINPYDIEVCQQIVQAHYLSKIKQKFGCYTINDYNKFLQFDDVSHKRNTPRLSLITAIIPCASFYYLEYLKELQAEKIVDIGCGMNFFKDIVPNVIGIDTDEKADINDLFDAQFSAGHKDYFKCAFSIDSLHFISITNFYNRVLEFSNIVTLGGRGYLSMNAARMIERTSAEDLLTLFNTADPSVEEIAKYIDQEIQRLPMKLLVVDNLITDCYDEFVDGNIRIVFEK